MKYSIITPVFNREDCVQRCIDSVCRNLQWNIDIEHIIVNDGSTDNTASIVQQNVEKYSHIRFINFEHNQGTNAARNTAINAAIGDFCIILDSDDYFLDNALKEMHQIVSDNSSYKHFMFAPDDMEDSYKSNNLLNKQYNILKYEDFLLGKIAGDFIHVIATNTLKKYPFGETVRIHEGVFFLRFYKEAQNMLFFNKTVTIRERNRIDSVTRETIRTKKVYIERILKASHIQLEWFKEDYIRFGCNQIIDSLYAKIIENSLLLSHYDNLKVYLHAYKGPKCFLFKIIYFLRFGWLYKIALNFYLIAKYRFFHHEVK